MAELRWPKRPTCHDGGHADRFPGSAEWRPEDPQGERSKDPGPYGSSYGYPFKTCGYCGSMSAEDLYRFMTDGVTPVRLDMADWKYGWPHKFYIEGIPNPKAGQQVGGSSTYRTDESGKQVVEHHARVGSPTTFAKFYTEHLADLLSVDDGDATFAAVCQELLKRTGVAFTATEERRLRWAMHRGHSHG